MIVYGASGHAKVIIELLELNNINNIVIWDDADKPDIWKYQVKKPSLQELHAGDSMVIAIGNNSTRKKIAEQYENFANFFPCVHPAVVVSARVKIDVGTVVMGGGVINPD